MNVQNLTPAAVEIETLGPWRLDGKEVAPGARLAVLPSLAADLVMRGKARRVSADEQAAEASAEASAQPDPQPDPTPETPPAPAVPARGKK